MRIFTSLILSLVIVNFVNATDNTVIQKTPLTSIGAVSSLDAPPDPDDPGIGGGFDQISYFKNRFIPQLDDCTNQIEEVFINWTVTKGLILPRREVELGNVLIHATKDKLGGFFELIYRVDAKRERARTSVFYFFSDGSKIDPVYIKEFLENWQIAILQDDLDKALNCGQS